MITVFFKASLPMERALAAFIAKVEGVVIENFSGGFAPRPPQILYYFLAPPIQKVLRGPWLFLIIEMAFL